MGSGFIPLPAMIGGFAAIMCANASGYRNGAAEPRIARGLLIQPQFNSRSLPAKMSVIASSEH
jgi:hypothetical protein